MEGGGTAREYSIPTVNEEDSERDRATQEPAHVCLLREDLETRRSKWEEDSEEAINRSSQVLYYSIA